MGAGAMERADTDFHEMTEQLLARGEEVVGAVDYVGFDGEPAAEPEAADGEGGHAEGEPAPAKSRPRRHTKARARPHAVHIWFDDREITKLTGGAVAEGIKLADFVRARALRDPRAHSRQAPPGADLSAPDVSSSLPNGHDMPVRNIPPLPSDIEKRINVYYAPDDRFEAILPRHRGSVADVPARPKRLARLGHFFTALVGA